MTHRPLDYQSWAVKPRGWRVGDWVFLGTVVAYCLFNVVLLLLGWHNMLGRLPFGWEWTFLITLLLGVSSIGVLAAFPIQFLLRPRVTWRSAVAVIVCFVALSGFNFTCAVAAAGAVTLLKP